jgi:hypothetical protein
MTPPENHHTFAMPLLPYRAGTGEVAPVEVRDPRAKAASGIPSLGGHAHVQHLRLTGILLRGRLARPKLIGTLLHDPGEGGD